MGYNFNSLSFQKYLENILGWMKKSKQKRESWKMELLSLKIINAQKKCAKAAKSRKEPHHHQLFSVHHMPILASKLGLHWERAPLDYSKIQSHPQQNQPVKLTPQKNRKKKIQKYGNQKASVPFLHIFSRSRRIRDILSYFCFGLYLRLGLSGSVCIPTVFFRSARCISCGKPRASLFAWSPLSTLCQYPLLFSQHLRRLQTALFLWTLLHTALISPSTHLGRAFSEIHPCQTTHSPATH